MIPRTFHRIWLGGNEPAEFAAFGASWLKHHPGWTMQTLTDPAALGAFQNADLLDRCRNHAQRSDVLRYELLWLYGGVYLDTDFECLKNIEPLLADASFVGAGERVGILSAGFIAATPQHPLVARCRAMLRDRVGLTGTQAKLTGPGLITDAWKEFLADPSILTYGPELFYPYPWTEKHRRHEEFPDAYAVHHWAGSWLCSKPH